MCCVAAAPPPYALASPLISVPHRSGTFVTTDKPTLTRCDHRKSRLYMRVHHLCCNATGLTKCVCQQLILRLQALISILW